LVERQNVLSLGLRIKIKRMFQIHGLEIYGFCFKFCFCEGLVKFFYKYKVILGYTGYKPTMDNDTAMGGLFGTC